MPTAGREAVVVAVIQAITCQPRKTLNQWWALRAGISREERTGSRPGVLSALTLRDQFGKLFGG